MGNFVVAGGTKGIGLSLVQLLAEEASRIDVYSREIGDLTQRENVEHHCCDFLDGESELAGIPESIQGAVYCPGTINLRSFRSLKIDDIRNDLELNVLGAIRFLQACFAGLKKGANAGQPSSVVLFSTVAVARGMPMHASVAVAKGALEGLTRSLAAEWSPNIRVNCIAPALTDTPLAERFFRNEESRKAMAERYPLGRTGMPLDVASAAKFLLSPESSWITGQVLGVDGGMSSLQK